MARERLRVITKPEIEADATESADPESLTVYADASKATSVALSPIVIRIEFPAVLTENAVATGGVVSTSTVERMPAEILLAESTA
jgi:hypothetical protein